MAGTTLTTKFTNLFRHSTKHTKKAVPRILTVLQNDRADITNTRLEAVEGFPICVLLTEPILAKETDDYTVKNVKFVVESNDQGWCNEDNFEGEYEGSWTWFEVAILRSLTAENEANRSPKDEESIDSEPCIKQALHKKSIDSQRFVTHGKRHSAFWHLQRNRRGREEPSKHTIEWNQDSKESASERLGWDFNPENGAGSGVDFVRSLQRGDRVAVIAHAKQSGSVNYISGATMEIQSEANQITADAAKPQSGGSVDNSQRSIGDNSQRVASMNYNIQAAADAQAKPTKLRPFRVLGTGVVSAMRWARNSTPPASNVDSKVGKSKVA